MDYFNLVPLTAIDPVLEQSISAALLAYQPHTRAISVNHIRETVLLIYPTCEVPVVILNKHIGDQAIRGGYNVHFDGEGVSALDLASE
ncbi:hypothetical protein [Aquibium oceanicum]|uniref:Uncharacterized protein n=1 Tax=Aquibium oceanicum TaxID=1670800 RepID=A0A1L3SU49_9HYPH|nr:hypothetical protein [Aquibium oceanicum]APH72845.1 hypothetical protein BSQ44_16820 [Aquibium oceanicum]